MLPDITANLTTLEVVEQPSQTYAVDFDTASMQGKTDGMSAIMQAVQKMLYTMRYAHVIYSGQYGSEVEKLVGKDIDYVKADIQRILEDALLADTRITSLTDFVIETTDFNSLSVSFTVNSIFGSQATTTEVIV